MESKDTNEKKSRAGKKTAGKTCKSAKNTISMMTNIRLSVTNSRPNAEKSLKAKYLLSMVKMRTGINENRLLPELILEGLRHHEITSKYYNDLQKDWEQYKESNNIKSDII